MPSIPLHAPRASSEASSNTTAIPQLIQTPGGLAIMEIQGHINTPTSTDSSGSTAIGRLVFPEHDASSEDATVNGSAAGVWMHKVYFYIGHQRMLGQVKKLAKPLAIIGRRNVLGGGDIEMNVGMDGGDARGEQLEILDIVRWKILCSSRPEPVGEEEND